MKSKLTIALAVLLLAVLAMPHTADAQDGYTVGKTRGLDKVIASGNNQAIPAVVLTSRATSAEPPITRTTDADLTLTVTFGGLPIVQATAWTVDNGTVDQVMHTADPFDDTSDAIQFKMGDEELQIFVPDGASGDGVDAGTMIKLADLRVDATSLDDGDSVPITVTASDQTDTVDLGTGGGRGSVSASLTTAADGLTVAAVKGNGLTCGTITGVSVTVAEGFARAWNPTLMGPTEGGSDDHATAMDGVSGSVQVRLDVLNFPDSEGAKIEWPDSVGDKRDDTDAEVDGDQQGLAEGVIATLTRDKDASDANGKFAIYAYADNDSMVDDPDTVGTTENEGLQRYLNDAARSFKIEGLKFTNFGGAAINVTARLWPPAKRNSDGKKNAADLGSTLSFEHAAQDPEFDDDEREGAWLIVADCVTYLLYPFVTCQTAANPAWTTGISVSNTSRDAGVFGAFDETEEQSGSVTFYGFPKSVATLSGSGQVPQHVASMLTPNLAAGDTYAFTCHDSVMAGMEGYAIIKANFQHARGMGFVIGSDVAHGYVAEVIDNPADRSDALK